MIGRIFRITFIMTDTLFWDESKRLSNLAKHGVDFAAAVGFDWDTALVQEDERFRYNEQRFVALGWMSNGLHMMAFTMVDEDGIRIITLRKATKQEKRLYGKSLET